MKPAAAALVLTLVLTPLSASAKQMLGVLRHGSSVVLFVLTGATVVIEEQEAGATRRQLTRCLAE